MATVDGLTKDRMLAIEAESITAARIDPDTHHLILTTHGGTDIDVGSVLGPVGPPGPPGAPLPGSSVVGPPAFGDAPVVGVSPDYSRKDHKHGLPAAPPGTLLGVHEYAPVVLDAKGTVSTVLVAMDTVNAVTEPFVVPTSGRVLVKVSGTFYMNNAGPPMFRALFDHGTTNQVGFTVSTIYPAPNASVTLPGCEFLVDGLVPGSTRQFDLAWATSDATALASCNCKGEQGVSQTSCAPLLLEVWSA